MSERELDDLRWHWGEAYIFMNPRPDLWLAERRDDRSTLRADSPESLLDKIRADYLAHPVSRRTSRPGPVGGTRSGRGLFLPEG